MVDLIEDPGPIVGGPGTGGPPTKGGPGLVGWPAKWKGLDDALSEKLLSPEEAELVQGIQNAGVDGLLLPAINGSFGDGPLLLKVTTEDGLDVLVSDQEFVNEFGDVLVLEAGQSGIIGFEIDGKNIGTGFEIDGKAFGAGWTPLSDFDSDSLIL